MRAVRAVRGLMVMSQRGRYRWLLCHHPFLMPMGSCGWRWYCRRLSRLASQGQPCEGTALITYNTYNTYRGRDKIMCPHASSSPGRPDARKVVPGTDVGVRSPTPTPMAPSLPCFVRWRTTPATAGSTYSCCWWGA